MSTAPTTAPNPAARDLVLSLVADEVAARNRKLATAKKAALIGAAIPAVLIAIASGSLVGLVLTGLFFGAIGGGIVLTIGSTMRRFRRFGERFAADPNALVGTQLQDLRGELAAMSGTQGQGFAGGIAASVMIASAERDSAHRRVIFHLRDDHRLLFIVESATAARLLADFPIDFDGLAASLAR